MRKAGLLSLTLAGFFMLGISCMAHAQEAPETQWLWGEVVSVDVSQNQLTVKYLDYDLDQEKETTVAVDDKTTFENARSLLDVKPLDTVSIDFVVSADSKNIAKNISLEKPEAEGAMTQEPTLEEAPAVIEAEEPASE